MDKTSIILTASPEELEYIQDCIGSIRNFTDRGTYEIIVVEHGGSLELRTWLAEQTDILSSFHEDLLTQAAAWNTGLEIAHGDSIAIMHGDTLVTPNWLLYLLQSLYQDETVGAVGPITSHSESDQSINKDFDSMEEMLQYAKQCQRNFEQEERVSLDGFCILFRKEAISRIGLFDTQFKGSALTSDYVLRLQQEHYKLVLSKNVFIHHYQDREDEEVSSVAEFMNKWGFHPDCTLPDIELYSLLNEVDDSTTILTVGDQTGANILKLKQNSQRQVEGIKNPVHFNIFNEEVAQYVTQDLQYYLDTKMKFDYIVLYQTSELKQVLVSYINLLKSNGKILFRFENMNHYSVVQNILVDQTFTTSNYSKYHINDVINWLGNIGLATSNVEYIRSPLDEEDKDFINGLRRLNGNKLPVHFDTKYFVITATLEASQQSSNEELQEQFNQLFQNPTEEAVDHILNHNTAQILNAVKDYTGPAVPLLNYLALTQYENNKKDQIFPLLNKAYEINPEDGTTLLNLGTIHYGLGNEAEALQWFKKVPEQTAQIESWIYELEETIALKSNPQKWFAFLLLRIEHNVQRKDSLNDLLQLIETGQIYVDEMESVMLNDIIEQVNTTNILVNYFYEMKRYDLVITILEISLNYTADRDETLFLIANINYKTRSYPEALQAVEKIKTQDAKTTQLLQEIKAQSHKLQWK
ncbi:glycosyltransferase [Paenibacillus sp. PsM32]|uniref:glycosyltransferase n=1 Tax=Paenibacillus sp. PsM32 TaxID=3030536 RepID=UPI00263AF50B|nr:glycosyltransferase [Paenibacillus sp. PsM32]MDN4620952.1 glycosyltransferase [Paenibacillus sp. PsM32]